MSQQTPQSFPGAGIDKSSPLPYHFQLREIIRAEIASSRWQVGDQLPSEREFCETFNISRTTVREALDALVSEGLLTREKGLGTFVAAPKYMERWSGSVVGFSDSVSEQGYLMETEVLELSILPASHLVRQELYLQRDEKVFFLKRRRFIHKIPILLVISYLPQKHFPALDEIDFTNRSLYETLRQTYGLRIARVKRRIEAIAAGDDETNLLQVDPGFPLMYIENTAFNSSDIPIEHFQAWRRGDRARFEFEYRVSDELAHD
jgi:GntR family transcriptional regulator